MFKLKTKNLDFETGGFNVVVLNQEFARQNDIHPMDRVTVAINSKLNFVAAIDISGQFVAEGEIGLFADLWKKYKLNGGLSANVIPVKKPESIKYIRKKMDKEELLESEVLQITKDIVDNKLTDIEMASFVSACYISGMSFNETASLTKAIVDTGGHLNLKNKIIADKHCIGGVPGNRTTMILVPIISSLGIMIPKTSSRAITSPAGTADTMEAIANVSFSINELMDILKKANGCIVWGGAINLAAADDKLIRVRHPLSLDPEGLMLASIMAKKKAVGSNHVIFDLPIGEEAKLHYLGEARHLEREFYTLGKKFGMKTETVITDGNEPIGNGIGPNLEARDVIRALRGEHNAPKDLIKKGIFLSGKLLELCGKAKPGNGIKIAQRQMDNGKAWKQMQKIIELQGGNPNIKSSDIEIGKYSYDYHADRNGTLFSISNNVVSKLCKVVGAPVSKSAGVYVHKHVGEKVRKGEILLTVYSNSEGKLTQASEVFKEKASVLIK